MMSDISKFYASMQKIDMASTIKIKFRQEITETTHFSNKNTIRCNIKSCCKNVFTEFKKKS